MGHHDYNNRATDLDLEQLETIVGGAANCTYASETYSQGAKIKTTSGETMVCSAEGTWKTP